ncbi:MAG: response regulator transcription factor [Flavobacteriales bacterium]
MQSITPREREVLLLMRMGKSNSEIAEALEISINTVKTHLKSMFNKLGVNNRTSASVIPLEKIFLEK